MCCGGNKGTLYSDQSRVSEVDRLKPVVKLLRELNGTRMNGCEVHGVVSCLVSVFDD